MEGRGASAFGTRYWLLLASSSVLAMASLSSCASSKNAHARVGPAAPASSGSWPVPSHDAGSTNFNPDEREILPSTVARLHPVWKFPYVTQAVVSDSRVYAIVEGNPLHVVVLDARTGRMLHSYGPTLLRLTGARVSPVGDVPEVLAYALGRLVIGTTTEIFAINPDTGHQYWRVPGGAFRMTVTEGIVYASKSGCQNPCGDQASVAIDLHSGRVLWRHPRTLDRDPVVIAGRLFQLSEHWVRLPRPVHYYDVRVYDPRSGKLNAMWKASYGMGLIGSRGGIYATYVDNVYPHCRQWVSRLNYSGKPVWKLNTGGDCSPTGGMALSNDALYVAAQNGERPGSREPSRIVAVDRQTGRIRWRVAIGKCYVWYGACQTVALVATNHLVFVGTGPANSSQIEVLNAQTGQLVRSWRGDSGPLLVAGGTLYAGSIVAYSLHGQPTPPATISPSPTPPATPYPSVVSLVRKSIAAMKSVRTVHAQGTFAFGDYRKQLRLHVSGNCDRSPSAGMPRGLIKATLHQQGGYYSFGKLSLRVDGEYIVIGTDRAGRAWERSAATHNRWRQVRYETSSLALGLTMSLVCPSTLGFLLEPGRRGRLKHLGPVTVLGTDTWRIQETEQDPGGSSTWDVYVDQGSLRQVRVARTTTSSGSGPAGRNRAQQIDYSQFNASLHIAPPLREGSSR